MSDTSDLPKPIRRRPVPDEGAGTPDSPPDITGPPPKPASRRPPSFGPSMGKSSDLPRPIRRDEESEEEYWRRRRRPDLWSKLPVGVSRFGWILVAVAIYFVARAQPPTSYTFFDRMRSSPLRRNWDQDSLQIAAIIMVVTWVLAVAGMVTHSRRLRRREDGFHIPLLMLSVVSFFGVAAYLVFF